MAFQLSAPALLLLEDGTVFEGRSCGIKGTTAGEICFNTSMTGYQEVFTDPSYFGQILVATNVHIGNYNVNEKEVESDQINIAGLVCKSFQEHGSRFQSKETLQQYFEEHQLVGITDVDTRAIVRHIRSKGAMNAIISSEILDIETLKQKLADVPSMKGLELSSKVATQEPYFFGNENATYKVAVLDLGIKRNILRSLAERDCYCKVFPMHTTAEEMEAWNPDGYFISNGPGDPETLTSVVENMKKLIDGNKKMFGICLGHQLLCWSLGIETYKMFNGHRGVNHPIINTQTGRGEITSQNHGFVANKEQAEANENVIITHYHLNDQTVAGIKIKGKDIFSVQYHPEASAGPHDSMYLFDDFVASFAK